jgi:hypothetical protein
VFLVDDFELGSISGQYFTVSSLIWFIYLRMCYRWIFIFPGEKLASGGFVWIAWETASGIGLSCKQQVSAFDEKAETCIDNRLLILVFGYSTPR